MTPAEKERRAKAWNRKMLQAKRRKARQREKERLERIEKVAGAPPPKQQRQDAPPFGGDIDTFIRERVKLFAADVIEEGGDEGDAKVERAAQAHGS